MSVVGACGYAVNRHGEIPVGVIDGVNKIFMLLHIPIHECCILVFRAGLLVDINEYTIAANILTFNDAPEVGDSLRVFYDWV